VDNIAFLAVALVVIGARIYFGVLASRLLRSLPPFEQARARTAMRAAMD
jgi:hypothetical protein